MQIWDAFHGQFLGSVHRASDRNHAERSSYTKIENPERDERYVPRLTIDPSKVHRCPMNVRSRVGLKSNDLYTSRLWCPLTSMDTFTESETHY